MKIHGSFVMKCKGRSDSSSILASRFKGLRNQGFKRNNQGTYKIIEKVTLEPSNLGILYSILLITLSVLNLN
jgi:hypothetical protein